MAIGAKRGRLRFTDGLVDYLQDTDYRLISTESEKDRIYKFRYDCYLREKVISRSVDERFTDSYDHMDNCWLIGIEYRGRLASSLRIHLATLENPKSPSLDVFPDIVGPLLEDGYKVVDPTKLVTDSSVTNYFPVMPFLAFRVSCMASDYLDGDYLLISIFEEHAEFYERSFGLKSVCDPRPYPNFGSRVCLLKADVADFWDRIISQYPIFRSTLSERQNLFDRPVEIERERGGVQPELVEVAGNGKSN